VRPVDTLGERDYQEILNLRPTPKVYNLGGGRVCWVDGLSEILG